LPKLYVILVIASEREAIFLYRHSGANEVSDRIFFYQIHKFSFARAALANAIFGKIFPVILAGIQNPRDFSFAGVTPANVVLKTLFLV